MNGTFTVAYDLEERLAAHRFYLRKRWISRRALRYFVVLTILLFLGIAIETIRDEGFSSRGLAVSMLGGLLSGCVGLLALAAYFRWTVPGILRRDFAQRALDGRSTRYTFDDDRLEIDDPFLRSSLEWHELAGWAENEQFLVLYRTDLLYYYLSKRQVGAAVIDAAKANLAAASVPAA